MGEETKQQALEKLRTVSDQYGHYRVVGEIKINSRLTPGEDVAELGSTLLAYIAWKPATEGQDLKTIKGSRRTSASSSGWRSGHVAASATRTSG